MASTLLLLAWLLVPGAAAADVFFDGSMGPRGPAPTRDSPDFATDYLVTYDEALDVAERQGIRRGANLFQSLDRIDLGPGERVSFQAVDGLRMPIADLERVIARITSGNPSLIQGVLRSEIPGADLFLLNPAGIEFVGPDGTRQLDLQGGFFASSADFLRFEDNTILTLADLENFSLSATPVESFGFTGGEAADVSFDGGALLALPEGEAFTAVAGDVVVRSDDVEASGGLIQLAAVGSAAAEVPVDLALWETRWAEAGQLGSVQVDAFGEVRTTVGNPGNLGRVVLRGGRLVVDDSRVQTGGNGTGSLALDVEFADEVVVTQDGRLQTSGSRPEGVGGARVSTRRLEASGTDRSTFVGAIPGGSGTTAAPFVVEADEVLVSGNARLLTEASNGAVGGELVVKAHTVEVGGAPAVLGTRATCARPPCGSEGGPARIEADRLVIRDGGSVRSDNFELGADGRTRVDGGGPAGDLHVDVDELVMDSEGRIEALAGPLGDGGDITIRARAIEMSGSAEINATTINDRHTGDIAVTSTESLALHGDLPFSPTGIFARSGELDPLGLRAGRGTAGSIRVDAPRVTLEGAAVLSTRSRGEGNPGSITVTAGQLRLTGSEAGRAEISARALDGDAGGSVTVSADDVLLESGGGIAVSTTGRSPGGSVDLDADTLTVRGVGLGSSAIQSDTSPDLASVAGDAGKIDIDLRRSLLVTQGGEIRALTTGGAGNAGTIDVEAGASVAVTQGGSISAAATAGATGEAGNVTISAPVVVLEDGSVTTEAANGTADGITEPIGGDISFDAGSRVDITSGSLVSARSTGTQDAGRISIDAGRDLFVADSEITTEATEETSDAAGGQIDLTATDEIDFVGSTLSTSVRAFEGNEDGGDITIDPRFVIVNRSQILAQAIFGNGGNIDIVAGSYLESADSLVDATSALGIDGQVNKGAPDTELKGELARLPSRFLDATRLLREHCAARAAGRGSFVVAGSAGGEAAPDRPLPARMPLPGDDAVASAQRASASGPQESDAPELGDLQLHLAALDCEALARELERRGLVP